MQVTFDNGLYAGSSLGVKFVYSNTSAGEVDFVLKAEAFRMSDDQGGVWRIGDSGFAKRYILAPGDRIEFVASFYAPGTSDRRVAFVVEVFGDVKGATWGFTLRGGQVIR